jgi:TDG/mug DNA glycosylase family protein
VGRVRADQRGVLRVALKPVPDVVGPGLQVLFCGFNPSLRSGETGFHFARPGNRFWPALHLAGFTPRVLRPEESSELPRYGVGVTNLVDRSTRAAADLSDDELRTGVTALATLAQRWQPATVAILGIGAFRIAFARPKAVIGPQPETVGGRPVWALPNPSGLNAHFRVEQLGELYAALRGVPSAARPTTSRRRM